MEQIKHNAEYRLIETTIFNGKNHLDLVYGIANDGSNEGLEVYYKNDKKDLFYKSRRWETDSIPAKYNKYFNALRDLKRLVSDGHKATIHVNQLLGY